MNASSPLRRSLQVLAIAQAIAIVVLSGLWLRADPAPPPADGQPLRPAAPSAPGAVAAHAAVDRSTTIAPAAAASASGSASAPADAGVRAVLYGTVRPADGAAPSNGVLWLFRGGKQVGTSSGNLPTFAFAGLEPGTYRLRSRIEDHLPIDREVEVRAPTTRLDLELPARWLLTVNVVTPDGKPWSEAMSKAAPGLMHRGLVALAFDAPLPGDLPASNRAEIEGGIGKFRVANSPFARGDRALPKQTLGVLTLPAGKPVHVAVILRQTVVAQQPVEPGQQELTFTLPLDALLGKLARVRLRVVDPSGAPIAKAMVACNDSQTGGGGKPTGDDGRAVLEQLVPGRLDLEIRAKDHSAPPVEILVSAGADLDLGDVTVQTPTMVELQFDNFGGKGSVRCTMLDPVRPGWVANDLYFSADNGASQKYPFFPARYGMLATGPNGVAIAVLDLRSPPAVPIRFDLRRGVDLRIEYAFGSSKAAFEVATVDGVLVRRREVTGSAGETVELPPGSYTVRVTDQAGVTSSRAFTLPAAGMELRLP
jgi:hypothetical protein